MPTYRPHWREHNGYEHPQQPFDAADLETAQRRTGAMAPRGARRIEVREMDGDVVARRWRLEGTTWCEHSEREAFARWIAAAEAETLRARQLLVTLDVVIAALRGLGLSPAQSDPREPDGIRGAKWEWTHWIGQGLGSQRDPWVMLELGGSVYVGGAYEWARVDEVRWDITGSTYAWDRRGRVRGSARVVEGALVFPSDIAAWIVQATGARTP